VSFEGEIYSYFHNAKNQVFAHKDDLFRLVINSVKGFSKALYVPDKDSDHYANLFESNKLPLMRKGAAPNNPIEDLVNGGIQITDGKFFSISSSFIDYSNSGIVGLSFYLKIRLYSLPSSGEIEPILTINGERRIQLRIKDDGLLQIFGTGSEKFDYTGPALVADGTWYHLVFSFSRISLTPTNLENYWMIEVHNHATPAQGGSFTCKKFFFKKKF